MRTTPDATVGMMDSAYFVSKNELLAFFNNTLDMNLTKIEQTCTGAVACQLCEYIFPKSIPVSRIDWSCKASFEYVANYKLLQAAFTKNRVRRHVDVDRLIRGKYQDNLEFCQWLKAWHDQQIPNREGYDPAAVRAKGKGGKMLPPQFKPRGSKGAASAAKGSARRPPLAFSAGTPSRPSSASLSSTPGTRRSSSIPSSSSVAKKRSSGIGGGLPPPAAGRTAAGISNGIASNHKENATPSAVNRSMATPKGSSRPISTPGAAKSSAVSAAAAAKSEEALVEANKKTTELTNRVAELELLLQKSEEDKEFYFEKLRGVEALVQANDLGTNGITAEQVVQRIGKVLSVVPGEEIPVDESGAFTGNDSDGDGDAMMDIAEPTSPYPAASDLLQEAADEGSDDMDLMMSPSGLMA